MAHMLQNGIALHALKSIAPERQLLRIGGDVHREIPRLSRVSQ
jgi:hypothetical protein